MKEYIHKCTVCLCAGAMLLAVGCQNTVNTVENAEKTMTPTAIADKRFVTDGFLRDRLKLSRVDVSETSDGLMRVQLTALNARVGIFSQMWSGMTGENPYKVQYRFSWFDRNGMAVNSLISTWKEITVIPGETVYLQSVAPLKECKDFSVTLKEAN